MESRDKPPPAASFVLLHLRGCVGLGLGEATSADDPELKRFPLIKYTRSVSAYTYIYMYICVHAHIYYPIYLGASQNANG